MVAKLKSFPCPSCGAEIAVRAHGISVTFICDSCGGTLDANKDGYSGLRVAVAKAAQIKSLLIPLGARGRFDGIEWEAIGFMRRKDVKWLFSWDEYLLFNPYHGFRFLMHSDGHFALASLVPAYAKASNNIAELNGDSFALFHQGTSAVVSVVGEFYWRVKVGDRADFADFIAPPQCLSREMPEGSVRSSEKTWSVARYVPKDEIRIAFNIKELPAETGSCPFQPNPYRPIRNSSWGWAILCFVVLLLAQIYFVSASPSQQVFASERSFTIAEKNVEITLGELVLNQPSQNIEIRSRSPVNNSWLEVSYEIESMQGNESAWTSQAIEYYHGYDSDGAWTEGGQSASTIVYPLGSNRYKVIASVDAESFSKNSSSNLSTQIVAGVPIWSNFFLAIFLIFLCPILLSAVSVRFEQRRWQDSDYSPL